MSRAHFFGVLLRWFAGVPSVATAHSQHFQSHWMCNDLVIAVSEATRRYQRRVNLVRSEPHRDDPQFRSAAAGGRGSGSRPPRRAASLGVADDTLLLGIVGTISPDKGHLYLIRRCPKSLPRRRRPAGDRGPLKNSENTGKRCGRRQTGWAWQAQIVWTGHRPDVPAIMSALDVCVVASLKENFPQVVLEAMAAGVPVVATAVGGIPECVVHGETGLLVPTAG